MGLDAEARGKLKRLVDRHKAERQELVDALQGAVDENDELKVKAAEADTLKTKLDELGGKVRAGSFRAAFDRAAKAAGVREDALDDAWDLAKVDTSKGE